MSKRNGFTLVEVMMVTAILAVVGVVLVTVMANGVDIWTKVTGMASEEGRVVFFDKLTTDLDKTINQKDWKFQGDNRAVHIPSVVAAADGVIMPGMRTYFFNSAKSTIEKREEDYRRVTQNRVPGESAVHTATDIPLSAFGPGAWSFTGVQDNTDVFFKLAQAANGVVLPADLFPAKRTVRK